MALDRGGLGPLFANMRSDRPWFCLARIQNRVNKPLFALKVLPEVRVIPSRHSLNYKGGSSGLLSSMISTIFAPVIACN